MAKNIKTRLSLIKSFIARTPEGQKYLNEQYESLIDEKRRERLNNIYHNEKQ